MSDAPAAYPPLRLGLRRVTALVSEDTYVFLTRLAAQRGEPMWHLAALALATQTGTAAPPKETPVVSRFVAPEPAHPLLDWITDERRQREAQRREVAAKRTMPAASGPTSAALRALREQAGLSQREVATLCHISRGLYCDIERGRRDCPLTRRQVYAALRRYQAEQVQPAESAEREAAQ